MSGQPFGQVAISGCAALCALMLFGASPAALAADYGAPPVAARAYAESPCYAVFHEGPDGQGISLERVGPEEVPDIRRLRYRNGRDLNRRVLSVTTGPAAVLTLYDARRFRVEMFEVGPGSRVNLARPVMDSYVLSCTPPPPDYRYK